MTLPRILLLALGLSALMPALGCDEEIGGPCAPNPDDVDALLTPEDDENRMAENVNFTNCSQALCLSVQGSRGFCTIECQSDAACPADFRCEAPILTGPFACRGFEEELTCEGTAPEDFIKYCTADRSVIDER